MSDQVDPAVTRRRHPGPRRWSRRRSATTASTSPSCWRTTGVRHPGPGLRQHRVVHLRDHLHRRRRRHPALPRLPDRAARREVHLPRDQLPADLRRAARPRPSWRSSPADQPAHAAARGPASRSSTASRATPTRCRCCPARSARCRPSTRTALDPFDPEQVEISTVRLLAKLPTIAAYAYKKSIGQPFLYPDNSLGLVENFLRMTFGFPAEPYEVDPTMVHALDLLLRSCTPTTSRTARPRPCGWSAPRTPTCSRRSRPGSTRCSARCTAGPTRRCWRCSSGSGAATTTSTRSSSR